MSQRLVRSLHAAQAHIAKALLSGPRTLFLVIYA